MSTKVFGLKRWPEADRKSWEDTVADTHPFRRRAQLAEGSRKSIASDYGRWLGFLSEHEQQAILLDPPDRLTPERVLRFIEVLRSDLTPRGVPLTPAGIHNYVKHTYDAIRHMYPKRDWCWLKTTVSELGRGIRPQDIRDKIVHSARLEELGIILMRRAQAHRPQSIKRAVLYRDGLIIALQSIIPLRRRNAAETQIGVNLTKLGDGFGLAFSVKETKNRRQLEYAVPPWLTEPLNTYLAQIRPRFRGANNTTALWVTVKGRPLNGDRLYDLICKRTRAHFEFAIRPHIFRHCAVTTIALEQPSEIGRARDLLGNGSFAVVDAHYNLGRSIEVRRLQADLVRTVRADYPQTE